MAQRIKISGSVSEILKRHTKWRMPCMFILKKKNGPTMEPTRKKINLWSHKTLKMKSTLQESSTTIAHHNDAEKHIHFDEHHVLHELKHYLPSQQALKDFIHHNS